LVISSADTSAQTFVSPDGALAAGVGAPDGAGAVELGAELHAPMLNASAITTMALQKFAFLVTPIAAPCYQHCPAATAEHFADETSRA
jgi:hypothetical protein